MSCIWSVIFSEHILHFANILYCISLKYRQESRGKKMFRIYTCIAVVLGILSAFRKEIMSF